VARERRQQLCGIDLPLLPQIVSVTAGRELVADELAEQGWLEPRFTDAGDLAWFWTSQAETALELSALTTGHPPN
jgi:hypothetical protein